ncbi:hypothetical protein ACWF2L_35795 [Streptomyces anulatus]
MAGTTAFVLVLLGCCVVAIVTVIAKARVKIARIQAGTDRADKRH